MIYYFNPGHETAILNESAFYQPPKNVRKMQEDLAFLPAWYAKPNDFVLCNPICDKNFSDSLKNLNFSIKPISIHDLQINQAQYINQKIDLWGTSPQAIHYFSELSNKYQLNFQIPAWNEFYKKLCSRVFSTQCLSFLMGRISEIDQKILPRFYSDLNEIEEINRNSSSKLLIKSPYSSSGRGLLWLEEKELSRSSKQIIQGMLKKQKEVSVERVLDKTIDFSMHFEGDQFLGYSLFQTNDKGGYEKTVLLSQQKILTKLAQFIRLDLIEKVKSELIVFIKKNIFPYYQDTIGVDMMIYQSGKQFLLHPCVEINLRKSMGYLSLCLFENFIHPESEGFFSVKYNAPVQKVLFSLEENRIKEGLLYLCPVHEHTRFFAEISIQTSNS